MENKFVNTPYVCGLVKEIFYLNAQIEALKLENQKLKYPPKKVEVIVNPPVVDPVPVEVTT
jgi:hypothetical protein